MKRMKQHPEERIKGWEEKDLGSAPTLLEVPFNFSAVVALMFMGTGMSGFKFSTAEHCTLWD